MDASTLRRPNAAAVFHVVEAIGSVNHKGHEGHKGHKGEMVENFVFLRVLCG
jgi:hypothetical protein